MKLLKRFNVLLLFICVAGLAMSVFADEKPAKNWKNDTEISYLGTNGNTKSSTLGGKETFGYTHKKTSLELVGGGLSASDKGQQTAERYFANQKVSYKLSEKYYTFEKGGWYKDRFAGIRNRYDITAGFGRDLISTPSNKLIGELSGGYIDEERVNQPTNSFASGRAYSKYTHTLSATANFSQDAEYIQNFEDPDDFRVNTETALIASLSVHFSLKASYTWKYVGQPPVGFGRSDTTTAVALIATY